MILRVCGKGSNLHTDTRHGHSGAQLQLLPCRRRAISTKYVQLTWGELLFMFLAIAVPAAAGILSWNSQGSTGSIAEFAFAVAFLLPMRNSVWAFVLGLPFERAIFWHNVASLITREFLAPARCRGRTSCTQRHTQRHAHPLPQWHCRWSTASTTT